MPDVGPPLLQDICLQRLSDHISEATSLAGLSEELVCVLFELVKSLNLQTLPPRLPMTRNRWLGQNPSWY
ncbi:hypothetical protein WJX77_011915 [Trebouxia sp. C0004]